MRILVFLLTSGAAWAQLSGPALGLVPDGTRIRQMYGIPGAGAVGSTLEVGRALAMITVSARPDFALAKAADNGEVLLIPGGRLNGVMPNPDGIVMSPRGLAAGFWFASASRFQIVSGLPGAPSVRQIDAAFPGGSPVAFVVSDDGNWLAGAWSTGVYAFGPDGSVNRLPAENGVAALAFFSQRPDLALASPQHISSITDIGGKATLSVLYDSSSHSLSPVGIATSSDNLRVVTADSSGSMYSIDLTSGAATVSDCGCSPEGLFGLGGSVFRLTGLSSGVKLFDASSGAILWVPGSSLTLIRRPVKLRRPLPLATGAVAGPVMIGGLPATTGYDQQPAMTISTGSPFPTDVTGTVTLTFASSVGGEDQLIQFGTGGRTVNFTIPAGASQATFSGKPSVTVMTGTVAGTITVAITSFSPSGTNLTTPVATATMTTSPTVPFIGNVTLSTTANTATVVVTGFASARDMVSGLFHFVPATGKAIAQTDITVPLSTAFSAWYQSAASNAFGSEFTLTVPFTVQGSALDIVAVTVTLTDSKGPSNPVSQ